MVWFVLKRSSVVLKWSGVVLKRSSVVLKRSSVVLKRSSVVLKWSGVVLKRSSVVLKWSGVVLKGEIQHCIEEEHMMCIPDCGSCYLTSTKSILYLVTYHSLFLLHRHRKPHRGRFLE